MAESLSRSRDRASPSLPILCKKVAGAQFRAVIVTPVPMQGKAVDVRAKPALGSTAKSSVKKGVDLDLAGVVDLPDYDAMHARSERYALQDAAARLLPESRTAKCLHFSVPDMDIKIVRSKAHGTCSYSGLQTCGSVWACPVCSAKISERRRIELQSAVAHIIAEGGYVSMLTLTTPHYLRTNLKELLAMQAKALDIFNSDRKVREILGPAGMAKIGNIRALEVTNGRKSKPNNGWHPHYHILIMHANRNRLVQNHEQRLFDRWVHACIRAGLDAPTARHGLKLHDGDEAAAYIAKWGHEPSQATIDKAEKWGVDREMTSGHTKKAFSGETPFDLLRAYRADDADLQAGALFIEYAEAFKGKRQLFWSPGLKAICGIEEKSDAEVLEEKLDDIEDVGTVTKDQFKDVRRVKGRGILLQIAARGGWDACLEYFEIIKSAPRPKPRAPKPPDKPGKKIPKAVWNPSLNTEHTCPYRAMQVAQAD